MMLIQDASYSRTKKRTELGSDCSLGQPHRIGGSSYFRIPGYSVEKTFDTIRILRRDAVRAGYPHMAGSTYRRFLVAPSLR